MTNDVIFVVDTMVSGNPYYSRTCNIIQFKMQSSSSPQARFAVKKQRLSLETRQLLVQRVSEGSSILSTAASMSIRPSTAKRIVKRFRLSGTFFESKQMRRERLRVHEHQNLHQGSDVRTNQIQRNLQQQEQSEQGQIHNQGNSVSFERTPTTQPTQVFSPTFLPVVYPPTFFYWLPYPSEQ